MPDSTLTTITDKIGVLTNQTYSLGSVILGISLAFAAFVIIKRLLRRA